MKPPLFITFEGPDGSGKTTQIKRSQEWLRDHDVDCLTTHEPGGTPVGDAIRSLFLDKRLGPVDAIAELLLVFASRRQHLVEVIEPALAAGRSVLCDRFTDSSYAYQGAGRDLPRSLIDRVDELATGGRRPDKTLVFDLAATVARERGQSRRGGDAPDGADRLDGEDLAFYERVRNDFLETARREPKRFLVIDASGSIDEVFTSVAGVLRELFDDGLQSAKGGAH